MRGEYGGAHNTAGRNQYSEPQGQAGEVKCDNVTLDQKSGKISNPPKIKSDDVTFDFSRDRRGGNSQQQGLRRLEKAATAGDADAAEMLRRVLDKNDPLTVNGACVRLGWRKPVKTIVNTDDGTTCAGRWRALPVRVGARRHFHF